MKKFNLSIQAVEDRTAPIMFTERNLPGLCCCSCCCSCCWGGGSSTNSAQQTAMQQMSVAELASVKGMSVAELNSYINGTAQYVGNTSFQTIGGNSVEWSSVNWGSVGVSTGTSTGISSGTSFAR